jgi:hypothetical protein
MSALRGKADMTTLAWAYRIYVDGMYVEIAKCWPMA